VHADECGGYCVRADCRTLRDHPLRHFDRLGAGAGEVERNLREEKAADRKLTAVAEARVNKGSRGRHTKTKVGREAALDRSAQGLEGTAKSRKRPATSRRRAS